MRALPALQSWHVERQNRAGEGNESAAIGRSVPTPSAIIDNLRDASRTLWHMFSMPKYSAAQTKAALRFLPGWIKKGNSIHRTYQFKDFVTALEFVNAVGKAAEKAWHHPDIDIRWNKVTLTLTTHSEGGLTEKDFELAQKFDQL